MSGNSRSPHHPAVGSLWCEFWNSKRSAGNLTFPCAFQAPRVPGWLGFVAHQTRQVARALFMPHLPGSLEGGRLRQARRQGSEHPQARTCVAPARRPHFFRQTSDAEKSTSHPAQFRLPIHQSLRDPSPAPSRPHVRIDRPTALPVRFCILHPAAPTAAPDRPSPHSPGPGPSKSVSRA